jgi:hypothetical protein
MPRPRSTRLCAVDGCGQPHLARGWCSKHYAQWYEGGVTSGSAEERPRCTVDGCQKPLKGRGLCVMHYTRWKKHGDHLVVKPRGGDRRPAEARWWAKVRIQADACWEWQGARSSRGYGRFGPAPGVWALAYRWGYERFVGPVPAGQELDHLCRNPSCVRFDHLEPVTHQENMLRGYGASGTNARKTCCPQGHPYDGENVRISSRGQRLCLTCQHLRYPNCARGHRFDEANTRVDSQGKRHCRACEQTRQTQAS